MDMLSQQDFKQEQVNDVLHQKIDPNRLGVQYKAGFVDDVLSQRGPDFEQAEDDKFAEEISMQQHQYSSSFLDGVDEDMKDFELARRRSHGVYVPKSKVDQWVGRKSESSPLKTLQLLNQESDDKYNIKQSPKRRDPRKTQPESELLKMHSSSSVSAARSLMVQKTGDQTPQDDNSPERNNKVEVINVDSSVDSDKANSPFLNERMSEVRNPRKSEY